MDIALQSSVWVTSPEYAGWLQKRGFHWRKLWKKRWVALHGAEIVYMDKEPTLENSSTMVMTKAQITSSTVIEQDDIDSNPLGFKVNINNGKSPPWCLRAETLAEKKSWLVRLNHVIAIVQWLESFEKVRVLGVGGTGVVYELLHKLNGKKCAMKEMEIKNKAQMQMALQEAEMLKEIMENISHPHIMHIEKVFQVGSKFYMVFPLCTGGELYEHIIRRGHFTEYDAALLMRDLIGGLAALHDQNILHLDIKPENILFETQDVDAKIKITDFGLSRLFVPIHEQENRDRDGDGDKRRGKKGTGGEEQQTEFPSMKELDAKVAQFFEGGVLSRERLRGTVGYMSPELILMGHCSKATDVFAAGVVLYILLCGRPPFQSKSNREVLEKTCRGQYSISGAQWGEVSPEAKDLVKKMLLVDPAKRISANQALRHPWLASLLDGDTDEISALGSVPTTAGGGVGSGPASARSQHSLGSLRLLSGHVAHRRSEKLASSFTRLVSTLQGEGAWGSTSNLVQHIQLADGSPLPESAPSDDDMMILQSPDVRDALTTVLGKVCGRDGVRQGALTMEQFVCALQHFGMAPGGKEGGVGSIGVPGMFLCRFIDRDGDGYISADDLLTTQALIMQKSELFQKAVFRMYSESVWYPGRQINMASYHRSPRKGSPEPGAKAGESRPRRNSSLLSSDSSSELDVVPPPKFITARHVGEVFTRLGYKAESGKHVFAVLYAALQKRAALVRSSTESTSTDGTAYGGRKDSSVAAADMMTPGPEDAFELDPAQVERASMAAYHVSSMSRNGSFSSSDTLNILEQERRDRSDLTDQGIGIIGIGGGKADPYNTPSKSTGGTGTGTGADSLSLSGLSINPPERTQSPGLPVPPASASAGASAGPGSGKKSSTSASAKMDIKDFMDANSMDDVLVQAILRRPRSKFLELLAKIKYKDGEGPKGSGCGALDTSILEQKLSEALAMAEENAKPTFPLANAVGRASINAAFDIAASITGTAQMLLQGLNENMEEDDDDDKNEIEGEGGQDQNFKDTEGGK